MKVELRPNGDCCFICPGCGQYHRIPTRQDNGEGKQHPVWDFNGDVDKPTFSPSLLVRGSHDEGGRFVCHSFIREGRIEFLGDCVHELAGKTVELPDLPPEGVG